MKASQAVQLPFFRAIKNFYPSRHKFFEHRAYETFFYINKNRTGYVPFKDSPHFKLCLQSIPSFDRTSINYNVKMALEVLWNQKARGLKG